MSRICLFLLLALGTVGTATAQKIGHVNFGNLLNDLPNTTAADAELKIFNDELGLRGRAMTDKFKADYAEAEAKVEDLAPVELKKLRTKLQKDQQAITKFQQEIADQVNARRRVLLDPIIRNTREVIENVAKANGYELVVDSSIFNFVLFGDDAVDLGPLVRKELGL
ncbi:OmpH family outer membrane protein [Neolewinella antarctica]|uniref:Outer membrane protein n=1 Tax=Neolewinella antarctica TaxID=442734 RepID=A0ABX0XEI6_9BACT|nr:OmpH family outer membrane protein [Neolewinella antarctica]NJC27729.1 outer membrane protein [Neolewinella antarctica]